MKRRTLESCTSRGLSKIGAEQLLAAKFRKKGSYVNLLVIGRYHDTEGELDAERLIPTCAVSRSRSR
jgi:hypothetical protein